MKIIDSRWRVGRQVGRTLYVERVMKDPSNLFGMVDDVAVAEHIVWLHNQWLERVRADSQIG